jgi:hypothetical protein
LAFRTFFGLCKPFYGAGEIDRDSLQTYLIGLKFYTTGAWPYFGPDLYRVDTGYHSQIAGALEGIVIGLPFHVLPIPETPFLVLNLLSMVGLALFAKYVSRRIPGLSFPFALTWLALLPWTLDQSTHIFNVSYLLFGSLLFFLGFCEAVPVLATKWLSPAKAFGLMGFGLFWDMQFHNSWILLPPFVLVAFVLRRKEKIKIWRGEVLGFFAGAVLPLACLVPTLLKHGLSQGAAGLTGTAMAFNLDNFLAFFTILARFLSLACFEIPRFIGAHTSERLQFAKDVPWAALPAFFLMVLGWAQVFVLLIWGWFKDRRHREAAFVTRWTALAFLWTWFCFWFSSAGASAHMYYVFFPLIALYAFYIWNRLFSRHFWRMFAALCLVACLWLDTGVALRTLKTRALYTDRDRVVRAIDQKDFTILWKRRSWALY